MGPPFTLLGMCRWELFFLGGGGVDLSQSDVVISRLRLVQQGLQTASHIHIGYIQSVLEA